MRVKFFNRDLDNVHTCLHSQTPILVNKNLFPDVDLVVGFGIGFRLE